MERLTRITDSVRKSVPRWARCSDAPAAPRRQGRRLCGFTLAESLIASVVLAIAVVGVATTIAASHQQSRQLQIQAATVAAARQLMEEIAAKPLVDSDPTPGWPVVTDRSLYDTVADYSGYTDASPLQSLAADVVHQPVIRTVTLHYPTELFGGILTTGEMVIIEVSARDSSGDGCTMNRLVSRANLRR
jgi:Tfp pilus assembly protein PilV